MRCSANPNASCSGDSPPLGGFDLDAAQTVWVSADVERYQVSISSRFLSTSRLSCRNANGTDAIPDAGDGAAVRGRKNSGVRRGGDAFGLVIATITPRSPRWSTPPGRSATKSCIERAEGEIDNFRAAFTWSRETGTSEAAMHWHRRCSRCGLHAVALSRACPGSKRARRQGVGDTDVAPACLRVAWPKGAPRRRGHHARQADQAERALTIAREVGDPTLWHAL